MGQLLEEVKLWNTPLSGAYLLWRFTNGYCKNHLEGDAPVGLLHFVAIAILTTQKLNSSINNHKDNLQAFIKGFEDKKDTDILLSIQELTRKKLSYTLESIDIAVTEGLLKWDTTSGKLYPYDITEYVERGSNLKLIHKKDGDKAEILGRWFAQHDIPTIANYLKIIL